MINWRRIVNELINGNKHEKVLINGNKHEKVKYTDVCFIAVADADPDHFRLRRDRSSWGMDSNNGDHSNNFVLCPTGAWSFSHFLHPHAFPSSASLRWLMLAHYCRFASLWVPLVTGNHCCTPQTSTLQSSLKTPPTFFPQVPKDGGPILTVIL